jgi:nicotinamidase-related amidase
VTNHDIVDSSFTVTPVRDATAAFTREVMHAAHELNGPMFAHAILTTAQLIAALPTKTQ